MLVKQPNGLYCFYDGMYDVPIKWNITKEQYIHMALKKARKEALSSLNMLKILKWYMTDFYLMITCLRNNLTNF